MHEALVTEPFRRAVSDYFFLVERSYARGSGLKLVGDRYQLNSEQRSMLYRGINGSKETARRSSKLIDAVTSLPLHVDGLNVLYTVMNYLYGRVLFVSTDGFLRDAAELHGGGDTQLPKRRDFMRNAIALLLSWLSDQAPSEVVVYLDEPVSMSGELAALLRDELTASNINGTAKTVQSADFELKRVTEAVIATSDSTIIDACLCRVCDVARQILAERFAPDFVDLGRIVRDERAG